VPDLVDGRLLAFVGVSILLIVTPGPDTALTIRSALRGGTRAAVMTALGVALGTSVWLAAAIFGVAVLIANSPAAMTVLRVGGAAYLGYLGVRSVMHSVHTRASAPMIDASMLDPRAAFQQGLTSNLLNPKAGTFFLTVMPTFIREGDTAMRLVLMVGAYQCLLLTWLSAYGAIVAATACSFGRERLRLLEGATGVVLLCLAGLLVTER
jgi:threonine/homoserine/homoserine lactone efflux protein